MRDKFFYFYFIFVVFFFVCLYIFPAKVEFSIYSVTYFYFFIRKIFCCFSFFILNKKTNKISVLCSL